MLDFDGVGEDNDASFGEGVVGEELVDDVLADGDDFFDAYGFECFGFEPEECELFEGECDGDSFDGASEESFSHADILSECFADGAASGLDDGGGDCECHGDGDVEVVLCKLFDGPSSETEESPCGSGFGAVGCEDFELAGFCFLGVVGVIFIEQELCVG